MGEKEWFHGVKITRIRKKRLGAPLSGTVTEALGIAKEAVIVVTAGTKVQTERSELSSTR